MQLFVPWYLLRYQLKAQRSLSFPLSAQSSLKIVLLLGVCLCVCVLLCVCDTNSVLCHHH